MKSNPSSTRHPDNLLLTLGASALHLLGCGSAQQQQHDPADDACVHMANGPNANSAASDAADAGAPDVSAHHTRHDITLTNLTGGNGGFVKFLSGKHTDFFFFLDKDIPFAVQDAVGGAVSIEERRSVGECAEVAMGHKAAIEVGTYYLSFGPTPLATVSLVVVESGGQHHHP